MKKALLILSLLLPLLTGCALFDRFKKSDPPVIPPEITVKIDPRALELCKPMVALKPTPPASDVDHYDILLNLRSNAEIYRDCSKRQADGVEIIKQLSNKKESK